MSARDPPLQKKCLTGWTTGRIIQQLPASFYPWPPLWLCSGPMNRVASLAEIEAMRGPRVWGPSDLGWPSFWNGWMSKLRAKDQHCILWYGTISPKYLPVTVQSDYIRPLSSSSRYHFILKWTDTYSKYVFLGLPSLLCLPPPVPPPSPQYQSQPLLTLLACVANFFF